MSDRMRSSRRAWRGERDNDRSLFYHLDRQPLERVLPELFEKCLERGWRAVVQVGSEERLRGARRASLDLPRRSLPAARHGEGRPGGGAADLADRPAPTIRTAPTSVFSPTGRDGRRSRRYDRVVMLFDGNDDEAVNARARRGRRSRPRGTTPPTGSSRAWPLGEEGVARPIRRLTATSELWFDFGQARREEKREVTMIHSHLHRVRYSAGRRPRLAASLPATAVTLD